MGEYALFDSPLALGGEPAPRARRAGPARSAGRSGAAAAVALALGLALLACLAFMVALPFGQIRHYELVGAETLGLQDVLAWSGLPDRARWISSDPAAVANAVAANPLVAEASVSKRFPDTLVIRVREREALAVVYARGESGRLEAHCVDSEGVVFAPAAGRPEANSLPVISGLEIRSLRYGLRLEAPFDGLLSSMHELSRNEPALLSALSEIRVVSKPGVPAELVVYPARYHLPVRMMPALSAELLKSMLLVLDVVEGKGLSANIRELDLRTDTFIYRTKEAISG